MAAKEKSNGVGNCHLRVSVSPALMRVEIVRSIPSLRSVTTDKLALSSALGEILFTLNARFWVSAAVISIDGSGAKARKVVFVCGV